MSDPEAEDMVENEVADEMDDNDDEGSIHVPLNDKNESDLPTATVGASALHHSNVSDLHSVASSTEADDIDDDDEEGEDVPPPPVDISQRIKQYHSAASPAISRSSSKKSSTSDSKKKTRRKQMSDSWIHSHVGRKNATPEIPPTVSDGDEEILASPSGHSRRSRKLKIPSWVSDNKNKSNTQQNNGAAAPTSPSRSARSVRTSASFDRQSKGDDEAKSPSVSRRRLRGRRTSGSSWIKKEGDKDDRSIPSLNTKSPVSALRSLAVPSSIAYPGLDDEEVLAALKDSSDDLYKTPISKKKFASALAAYVAQTPGSTDTKSTRSRRSSRGSFSKLDDRSVDRSVDSNDTLFDSEADISSDDNGGDDDDVEGMRRRLENKKDRIKRMRVKAKERMHQMQASYKEERDEWKTASMELERIKRERDRLLQDQAEERVLLKESQDAAQRKQDYLNKIQKAMERDTMCKATGATAGAKNALDLQSRIEDMVQENRRLQRENESLMQQKVVIKGDTKRRDLMFGDDDSENSFPIILLKFLQATTELQKEVTEQISAAIPDTFFSSHETVASFHQKSWEECQVSLNEAMGSSQHAEAIEKRIEEIHTNSERQLKALHRSKKEHEMKMENISQTHAEEMITLTETVEKLKMQLVKAKGDQEQSSLAHAQEVAEWKTKNEESVALKASIEDKEEEILRLKNEIDEIDMLRASVEDKKAEILRLKDDALAAAESTEDALGQLAEMKDKVTQQQEQIISLQIEKKEVDDHVQDLKKKLTDVQNEISSIQDQRESDRLGHKERIETMQAEIDKWKAKLEEAQHSSDDLDEVRDILKQRKDQVVSLNEDLREMKKRLADKEENENKIKSLRAALSEAESKATLQEEEYKSEKQKRDDEIARLRKEAERWEHEFDEVSGSQMILKGSLEHQQQRVGELEQEIDDLKVLLAEQAEDLQDAEDRLAEQGGSTASVEAELVSVRKKLEEEKSRHTTEMESLNADHTELEANLAEARNQIKKFESEAETSKGSAKEMEEAMELVGNLQTELKLIGSDHEGLKEEMNVLRKERVDIEEAKKQYEDKIAKLEKEIEDMSGVLSDSSNVKVKKENEALQQALEKIAGEYQQEIDSLREASSNLTLENEKQKKEIDKLENAMMERSLRAASQAKDVSKEGLESTTSKKSNEEWEGVDECFEHLHQSLPDLSDTDTDNDQAQSIKELEEKFQHLRETSQKREAILTQTVRQQKISIDSMFEDLIFARDQVAKFKKIVSSFEAMQPSTNGGQLKSFLTTDAEGSEAPSTDSVSMHGEKDAKQSDMLESILEKQTPKRQKSGTGLRRLFGSTNRRNSKELEDPEEDPAVAAALLEEKCRNLEEENQSLKSKLVKATTQYKEETYKHKKEMEELQLANEAVTLKNIALIDAVDNTYDGSDRDMGVDMSNIDDNANQDENPASNSTEEIEDNNTPEATPEPFTSSSAKIMRI